MGDKLKLLFVIVERTRADKVADALAKVGVNYEHATFAIGAASGIMELIGVDSEKSMIMGTVSESKLSAVKLVLESEFGFGTENRGLAFTVPISAVGGPASLKILTGDTSVEPVSQENKKANRRRK